MDTGATGMLVSEDLAYLFGMTEDTHPSPMMTGVDGQVIQCTWMVEFTAEFAKVCATCRPGFPCRSRE